MSTKILLFIALAIVFTGCGKDEESEEITQTKTIEKKLPFPPISNYEELDSSLIPPTLNDE